MYLAWGPNFIQLYNDAYSPILGHKDEDAVRELITEALRESGLEVMQACDSDRAMALLDTGVRFDLLVTDVGLPGLNGRQLAEIARQRLPQIRVLFMTGYAGSAAVDGGFVKAGMALISKPFNMTTLMERVSALLGDTEELTAREAVFDTSPSCLDV